MNNINDYMLQECFAINLKWYRLERNFTQEKLAELSNLTAKYISDLERCKYSPSLARVQDIANALEIESYILFMNNHKEDSKN